MKAALAKVGARTILIVSATDRTVPRDLSQEVMDGVKGGEWEIIPTIRGHLGGALPLPNSSEESFIATQVRSFLDRL